jgi:hypothetical protein
MKVWSWSRGGLVPWSASRKGVPLGRSRAGAGPGATREGGAEGTGGVAAAKADRLAGAPWQSIANWREVLGVATWMATVGGVSTWAGAQSITNAAAVRPWSKAVLEERADIVLMGDSNIAFGGYGFDAGMIRAARSTVGSYGTGLMWFGENRGMGAGLGDGYGTINGGTGFRYAESPIMAADMPSDVTHYLYLPSPETLNGARQAGLTTTTAAVDSRSTLRWHVTDGTFPGGGSWRPVVRLGVPPYSTVTDFGPVSTAGELGLRTRSFTIAADPTRTAPLEWRLAPQASATQFVGDFLAVRSRVEDPSIEIGAVVHTSFLAGGRSARFMAQSVQATTDAAIGAYFRDVRAPAAGCWSSSTRASTIATKRRPAFAGSPPATAPRPSSTT